MEKSKLIFIRNGKEYPAKKARAHLLRKYNYMKGNNKTVKEFIERLASKSSLTGVPYYVKYPDGSKIMAKTWFYREREKMKIPAK